MDAQTSPESTAALCAIVQSVARLELEERYAPAALLRADELLAENRFLAARDGIGAALLDPVGGWRVAARAQLDALVDAATPHAAALGCAAELDGVVALAAEPGFGRQLDAADAADGSLPAVVAELARAFAPPR